MLSEEEASDELPKKRQNDSRLDIVGRSLLKTLDESKFFKYLPRFF